MSRSVRIFWRWVVGTQALAVAEFYLLQPQLEHAMKQAANSSAGGLDQMLGISSIGILSGIAAALALWGFLLTVPLWIVSEVVAWWVSRSENDRAETAAVEQYVERAKHGWNDR